jgi:hypothetical protein
LLWSVSLFLIALGAFRQIWVHQFGVGDPRGLITLIDLNFERSIPTWWSTLLLAAASALLALNGAAEANRRWKPYWYALAAVFLYLSLDEAATIHEKLTDVLSSYRDVLNYPWIIPYGIAAAAIAALYVPFVLALPSAVRWRVIFAGCLYLTAVIVLESIGGYCVVNTHKLCTSIVIVAEESGEIIAIVVFIVALLMLLNARCRTIAFKI